MPTRDLPNKPLAEAIFELRWELESKRSPGVSLPTQSDPEYAILLGLLFDRLKSRYPIHQPLPAAAMPVQMVPYIAQHQFRSNPDPDIFPVIQLGPGVLSLNERAGYTWSDFRERAQEAIRTLFDVYPNQPRFKTVSLRLGYINTIAFDPGNSDILNFLRDQMNVRFELGGAMRDTIGGAPPSSINWETSFPVGEPAGNLTMHVGTGQQENARILFWRIEFQSEGTDKIPEASSRFAGWLDSAHAVVERWFFSMMSEELKRRFSEEQLHDVSDQRAG